MKQNQRHRRKPVIDIVPLVDVLIVLIFFFLMTMQFRGAGALGIIPPESSEASQQVPGEMLLIDLEASGDFRLDSDPASPAEVRRAILLAADMDSPPQIVLNADENAPLQKLVFLIDLTAEAKLPDLKLLTREPEAPPLGSEAP